MVLPSFPTKHRKMKDVKKDRLIGWCVYGFLPPGRGSMGAACAHAVGLQQLGFALATAVGALEKPQQQPNPSLLNLSV